MTLYSLYSHNTSTTLDIQNCYAPNLFYIVLYYIPMVRKSIRHYNSYKLRHKVSWTDWFFFAFGVISEVVIYKLVPKCWNNTIRLAVVVMSRWKSIFTVLPMTKVFRLLSVTCFNLLWSPWENVTGENLLFALKMNTYIRLSPSFLCFIVS